ncbi:MAG: hypothetical protein F7C36_01135 [Desulfurococcales archaeon]|nr:hypothetical protein [Desulfurococcales archaeon]
MDPVRDELREKILQLIDEHKNNWVLAAYYSDPDVDMIMKRLVKEWEENSEKGKPIDYATREELEILYLKAKKYAFMSEDTARAIAMSRMGSEEEKAPSILGVFRKLFSRDR